MPKPLVVANWKMQLTPEESAVLARAVVEGLSSLSDAVDLVLCPSFTALEVVRDVLTTTGVSLGAQDVFPASKGALTGMVGFDELRALRVSHIVVGHSERRRVVGETNVVIKEKFHGAIAAGFTPILCVGETAEEKERGERAAVLADQLSILAHCSSDTTPIIVAYEPVWAIGTGVACLPEDAEEVHRWIRTVLASSVSDERLRVLYGGSVDEKNAEFFASKPSIDGVLVGGASLQSDAFLAIAAAFAEAKT
jgi:triosephosphate isomerase